MLSLSVIEKFPAPIVWGFIFVCLLVQNVGCYESASAVAKPRSSTKTKVTAHVDGSDKQETQVTEGAASSAILQRRDRTLDMSFLHEDHFAVTLIGRCADLSESGFARFSVVAIFEAPAALRWLEERSSRQALGSLDFVRSRDRRCGQSRRGEGIRLRPSSWSSFLEPYDKKVLVRTIENRQQSESHSADSQLRSKIEARSDRQIAIGTAAMLEKLSAGKGNGVVASAISKIGPDVDVALSLTFEPVRGALQGVMAMGGRSSWGRT